MEVNEDGDEVPTIEHDLGYGEQRKSNGRMAFYGKCSCGMRWPARGKLTHVISDLRTHSGLVLREAKDNGWAIRKGQGLAIKVVVPDTPVKNESEMHHGIAQAG